MPTEAIAHSPITLPYKPPRPGVPRHIAREDRTPSAGPQTIRRGTRLGRYVIDGELGRGGMGMVFAAIDLRLGRRAAIKVVRSALPAQHRIKRGEERLLREAQALARIDHPNIVSLFDVGTAPGGLYIAMEELHGISLRTWLGGTRRPWKEIVEVFTQAGRGLAAAHRAGVIHRDFKPSNVHIDDSGRVVVLDFGLAVATGDMAPDPARSGTDFTLHGRLTEAGIVLGTTGYIAPEQLLHNEAGPRSDQFAFCVALYEALLEERPYPGENAIEAANAFREGRRNPTPRKRIPRHIRRALERGLAIDPEARWPSMDALVGELNRDPHQGLRSLGRTAVLVASAWAGAYGVMWVQMNRASAAKTSHHEACAESPPVSRWQPTSEPAGPPLPRLPLDGTHLPPPPP